VLPQAFFVERVADDLVNVEVMIPPGANPVTYEPTMRQLTAITHATLYVKVGHPNFAFERAWLEKFLADSPGVQVVDASAGVERKAGDPHVWVSPACARIMVKNIAAALIERLPAHQAMLEANRDQLLAEIDAVDAELRTLLQGQTGRKFLVFHPAWGYFAEEYGLEQIAIEQGAKEPDARALAALITQAKAEGIQVIFVQPQFDRRSAELIAQEIGGTVAVIDPLARDWLQNMRQVAAALHQAFSS
jgi:zinc transport system substrate-binding protein